MVLIPAGTFRMGAEDGHADEAPVHEVRLPAFYLDVHEVTNRQFAAFVAATGYRTQAERDGYAWCFLKGFREFQAVEGADWKHPAGPSSSITEIMDHPVVCVSWQDAAAYATWAGKRLPSEAEWEYAARAAQPHHLKARTSASHEDLAHVVPANVWQGIWPQRNQRADGYYYTSPVASYPPNRFGLYDMIGNVWEWCSDWYAAGYYKLSAQQSPRGPVRGEDKVARGGSWFCNAQYCTAYSTHFRGASPKDHAFNNVGFRCARD